MLHKSNGERWGWVSFLKKLGQKQTSNYESHDAKNWNLWATFLSQTLAVNLTQMALKAPALGEMKQNDLELLNSR